MKKGKKEEDEEMDEIILHKSILYYALVYNMKNKWEWE